jgi:hypothetical protein
MYYVTLFLEVHAFTLAPGGLRGPNRSLTHLRARSCYAPQRMPFDSEAAVRGASRVALAERFDQAGSGVAVAACAITGRDTVWTSCKHCLVRSCSLCTTISKLERVYTIRPKASPVNHIEQTAWYDGCALQHTRAMPGLLGPTSKSPSWAYGLAAAAKWLPIISTSASSTHALHTGDEQLQVPLHSLQEMSSVPCTSP